MKLARRPSARFSESGRADRIALVAIAMIIASQSGHATDSSWTGGTSTTWSTGTNWSAGVPGSTDNAVFSGTFANQPTLTANTVTAGGLWMTGTPGQNVTISGAFNLNLGGNTINLTSGLGILIDNTNARTFTISSNPQLQGAQTWKNSSGNLFTVNGSTQTSGNALTLTNTGTGGTTLSGTITGSGAITVNNTGSGVTTFSNTGSTYTGQLTVQSGTLKIDTANNSSNNGELGNSSASVILGGSGTTGTLEYSGSTASSSKKFTMAAGGTGTFQIDTSGQTLTLSGVIDGSGALSKNGAGNLTLSGTNSYAGGTTIGAGTVSLSNASGLGSGGLAMSGGTLNIFVGGTTSIANLSGTGGTIQVNGNSNTGILSVGSDNTSTSFSGILTENGNPQTHLSLIKVGTGTLSLAGTNTYTGTTTVGSSNGANAGTLQLSGSGLISNAATTVFGGTLDLNGTTQTITATTALTLGGGASASAATVTIGSGELKLGGNVTYDAMNNPNGATISSTTGKLSLLGNRTLAVGDSSAAADDLTISAMIQDGDATARSLTKSGAGTLALTGNNTYSGGTALSAGTIAIANNNALGSATLTVTGAATVQSDSASSFSLSNNVVLANAGGTTTFGTAGTGTLTFGTLTLNSSPKTVDVENSTTTFSSSANDGMARTLTKNGPGALILTGNAAHGGSVINAGILAVGGSYTSTGNINLAGGVIGLNGSFTRGLGTASSQLQWTNSGGFAAYGTNATWGNAANNLTVNLGGAGAILTWGSTPQFLASGKTLILGSTISNGTVTFQNGLNFGASDETIQVDRGATAPTGGVDAKISGIIGSSGGGLIKSGAGILQVTANNNYTGATTINANGGILEINNTNSTSSGRVSATSGITVNSGGTLLLSGSSSFNDRINNNASVAINSGGILNTGGLNEGPTGGATGSTKAMGALTLNASSTIDFTSLNSSNVLFDSLTYTPTSAVTIAHWTGMANIDDGSGTNDRLLFISSTGLNGAQLASFQFTDDTGALFAAGATQIAFNGYFELVPAPEPSTWGAGALALSVLLYRQRRRLLRAISRTLVAGIFSHAEEGLGP